jgi:formamidopyrimidine-DNA glycosylase
VALGRGGLPGHRAHDVAALARDQHGDGGEARDADVHAARRDLAARGVEQHDAHVQHAGIDHEIRDAAADHEVVREERGRFGAERSFAFDLDAHRDELEAGLEVGAQIDGERAGPAARGQEAENTGRPPHVAILHARVVTCAMPELPEVERARRTLERFVGQRITSAKVHADELVIVDGARAVEEALIGKRIERVRRHGKWMWLELDRPPHVLVHLGMSGAWHVKGEASFEYRSSKKGASEWPPRFVKIVMALGDGIEVALSDARRLGRVVLREDPYAEKPLSELGFDPLLAMPTLRRFTELMHKRRGPIKGLLLDQTFSAGVGNWVADEVLYQAAIDPRAEIKELTSDEVRRLHAKIRHVVKIAVSKDADSDRFPKSWLFHRRWEKGLTTSKGDPIEHTVVAGRTTASVPAVQRPANPRATARRRSTSGRRRSDSR